MKLLPSILPKSALQNIQLLKSGNQLATLASYEAGEPTVTRRQHGRWNTNPNSIQAQIERNNMQWNAEWLAKNAELAIGYLWQRVIYCTPSGWLPCTGDNALDADLEAYCKDRWLAMGVGCDMFEAFSRSGNVEQPVRGDAGLVWYRDASRLRLMEFSADQLGELYQFARPAKDINGWTYFAGIYFDEYGDAAAYRIYERGYNAVYTNPQVYPASDVIYMADNLLRAVRGITKFYGTIRSLTKSDQLFQYGMDAANKQAKTAVVVGNEEGGPQGEEYNYEQRVENDGTVVYIEKNFDGAQTEYQYNGDSYKLVQTTAPGPELIEGCRYADERSCISLNLPYSFLVNARDIGGAPSRLEITKAGNEYTRLRKRKLEKPFKVIVYMTIMEGVANKVFKGAALRLPITKGTVRWPNLPTADAFKDTKDDIASNRAGLESKKRILSRYDENWAEVLSENQQEAIDVAVSVQDANRKLANMRSPIDGQPYDETISSIDIAQNSDNPLQSAQGEQIEQGKPLPKPVTAKLAAYMGDITIDSLPDDAASEVRKVAPGVSGNAKVVKYGMTVPELLSKADAHNMETARQNVRNRTRQGCAEEVHAKPSKHILMLNDKIVDGHHHLAKAEKGKVSKSLAVIDLTPLRFQ